MGGAKRRPSLSHQNSFAERTVIYRGFHCAVVTMKTSIITVMRLFSPVYGYLGW